nr:ribosome assembly RNA-binding protein YhbY [Sporolactobacillus vineae]
MLSKRQLMDLRREAQTLKPVFQIGKSGLGAQLIRELDALLEKRELIKVSLLRNTDETAKDAGERIAAETGAELVQVIGHTLILFRKKKNKDDRPGKTEKPVS